MEKILRLIGAPLCGGLLHWCCVTLLRDIAFEFFPTVNGPRYEFMLENFTWIGFVIVLIVFQNFVVIPKTTFSVKKAMWISFFFCVCFSLIFVVQNIVHGISMPNTVLSFTTVFVRNQSFWFGNLLAIYLLNRYRRKKANDVQS